CELSPIYDQSGVSTAVACKLLRELIIAVSAGL
ncbi:MAG TPA: agmatinase, partial [Candidatus Faeciplasma avium]|nr:agmatinase [Candidatus Faeciplasma avium]